MTEEYTTTLFLARECFVYRVPPRTSSAGYKAAEWGDMEAFLWKGRLRILEVGQRACEIRLEDGNTGDLFALCPYDISGTSVEPVLDSSRYFVLRVESDAPGGAGGKRKAYIGMGFQDRSDSFDFNVALQDWTKRQKSLLDPRSSSSADSSSSPSSAAEPSPHLPSGPKRDFSLKQGQTISVKIPGGGSGRKIAGGGGGGGTGSGTGPSLLGGGGGPLLPPPPSKRG
ncbi:uncharacterized protein PFL1_04677 [Pseudozyma flocculosa PF-1]|uniref:NECAP PHear domain-containing protein n=2 Tax=Pseudozyma flocculosa TaxID=84751 RepID=A0A5C3FED7_9BASI|nr:uncharacterized protein PFL1_04677 [Pseudozyma flocculosa PF-1]EPQ27933.1 hypothetical protein PFL1_04677 [Pseudozyma flocculosa PF-1]SPO41719.1 uncharacterized protein PSFLO_07201 [Pseudozyma flocculosa]